LLRPSDKTPRTCSPFGRHLIIDRSAPPAAPLQGFAPRRRSVVPSTESWVSDATLLGFTLLRELFLTRRRAFLGARSSLGFRRSLLMRPASYPPECSPREGWLDSFESAVPSEVCHLDQQSRVLAEAMSLGYPSGRFRCCHLSASPLRDTGAAAGAPRDRRFGDGASRLTLRPFSQERGAGRLCLT
jgi:hypothetical protein